MKYVIQSLWILCFYVIGVGVNHLINGLIPSSVIGMVLLFIALSIGLIKERKVKDVSKILLKYMVLFFLPASVGVLVAWDIIANHFWAILLSATVSTILVIIVVGVTQQKIGKKW